MATTEVFTEHVDVLIAGSGALGLEAHVLVRIVPRDRAKRLVHAPVGKRGERRGRGPSHADVVVAPGP